MLPPVSPSIRNPPKMSTELPNPTVSIPPRIYRVASQLQTLPVELIEPVISQLQISRVLELAIVGNNRLREVILDSPSWRHLFKDRVIPPEARMQELMDVYGVWTALHVLGGPRFLLPSDYTWEQHQNGNRHGYASYVGRRNRVPSFRSSPLFMFREESKRYCVRKDLVRAVKLELEGLSELVFRGEFTKPDRLEAGYIVCSNERMGLAGFEIEKDMLPLSTWDWPKFKKTVALMEIMQKKFALEKRKELLLLAGLIDNHTSRLKKLLDPREDRPSTSRIAGRVAEQLRLSADKTSRNTIFGGRIAQSWFKSLHLALIPRDVCLHLFIRVLKAHPLDTYPYPPTIKGHITTAFQGLRRVFDTERSPRRIYFRKHGGILPDDITTLHATQITRLTFEIPYEWYYRGILAKPHDTRETSWLQSFLTCVAYFEDSFPVIRGEVYAVDIPRKESVLQRSMGIRKARWEKRAEQEREKERRQAEVKEKERKEAEEKKAREESGGDLVMPLGGIWRTAQLDLDQRRDAPGESPL